ncbi:MAG: hypothetical protein ACTSU5_05575 [Promethearchaeota archaeon]
MTIEIDDSGTGDLIGPAFIGVYRQETGKLKFWKIGLEHFCDPLWAKKSPFHEARRIIREAVEEFKVSKDETIYLCRGNIFDEARAWLKENEYTVEDHVVEGHLQDAVEERLLEELRKIGVRDPKLSTKSGKDRYFVLFRWVCNDFPKREKFVKNGFGGWKKKWRAQAEESYLKRRGNRGGRQSRPRRKGKPTGRPARGTRAPAKRPQRHRLQ